MISVSVLNTLAKAFLFAIQAVAPDAAVCGGYLRDKLSGVPAKDIDIFCDQLDLPSRAKLRAMFPDMCADVPSAAAAYVFAGTDHEVAAVWSLGADVDGCPLQLIELTPQVPPGEAHKRNDFGICQIRDDGVYLTMTKAALRDMANNTFTLVECANEAEFERSMKRWARLQAQYPSHVLVNESAFQP